MKRSSLKSFVVYFSALTIIGVLYYVVYQRDSHIMHHELRYENTMDTAAAYYSGYQLRVAKKFSDTTLPQLQNMGLIIKFERNDFYTVVTVSGKLWKERSPFFKKSFLTELLIYIKVQDYNSRAKIIDSRTGYEYAHVSPPDQIIMNE
ncbi:MAG: hypothetical protein PHP42_04275 [Bacteroidota bacterium]|nr:hypothetical protein [Bacteroidota bacterium]